MFIFFYLEYERYIVRSEVFVSKLDRRYEQIFLFDTLTRVLSISSCVCELPMDLCAEIASSCFNLIL